MSKRSIGWYLEGAWLPLHGRLVGLWHWLRGHDLLWRSDPDWHIAHFGWIYCRSCPDCEGRDLCIWGRYWPNLHRLLIWICSRRGHGELRHPKKWVGDASTDIDNERDWIEVPDEWYCDKCGGEVKVTP